jgi:hypothetical protein
MTTSVVPRWIREHAGSSMKGVSSKIRPLKNTVLPIVIGSATRALMRIEAVRG